MSNNVMLDVHQKQGINVINQLHLHLIMILFCLRILIQEIRRTHWSFMQNIFYMQQFVG